jgi:hypothetical protein
MLTAIVIIALLGAVGGLTLGTPTARLRRAFRRTKLWSIAEFPGEEESRPASRFLMFGSWSERGASPFIPSGPSIGRVVGITRGLGETITAPLTGRTCLYYRVRAFGDRQLAEETGGVPFELSDGTGTALVDPKDAISVAIAPQVQRNSPLHAPTPSQIALLERHGYEGAFLDIRYEEAVIEVGAKIAVVGSATRDAMTRQLCFCTSPYLPLVLSTDENATHLSLPAARARFKP